VPYGLDDGQKRHAAPEPVVGGNVKIVYKPHLSELLHIAMVTAHTI